MQLIQIDSLQAKAFQTFVDAAFEIVRAAVRFPFAGTWPGQSAFGRDHKSFWIRMKRFCDEQLARFGSIRIGGVDQIDTELHCAFQDFDRVRAVGRPTPNAFARDSHGAKPKPIHFQIAA